MVDTPTNMTNKRWICQQYMNILLMLDSDHQDRLDIQQLHTEMLLQFNDSYSPSNYKCEYKDVYVS